MQCCQDVKCSAVSVCLYDNIQYLIQQLKYQYLHVCILYFRCECLKYLIGEFSKNDLLDKTQAQLLINKRYGKKKNMTKAWQTTNLVTGEENGKIHMPFSNEEIIATY